MVSRNPQKTEDGGELSDSQFSEDHLRMNHQPGSIEHAESHGHGYASVLLVKTSYNF